MTVGLVQSWDDYIYDHLDYEPINAMQELQAVARDLSARLDPLETTNDLFYRYHRVLRNIEEERGDAYKEIDRFRSQLRRSGSSLARMANCLQRVPITVTSFNDASLPGIVALMYYVRPDVFGAIDVVNEELTKSGFGTTETYETFVAGLEEINRFSALEQIANTQCDKQLATVKFRTQGFVVDPYFLDTAYVYTIFLGKAHATLTIREAEDLCGL